MKRLLQKQTMRDWLRRENSTAAQEKPRKARFWPRIFASRRSLVQYLSKSDEGLLGCWEATWPKGGEARFYAINKPYGISVYGDAARGRKMFSREEDVKEAGRKPTTPAADGLTLAAALPELAAAFNEERLCLVHAVPRALGLGILDKKEKNVDDFYMDKVNVNGVFQARAFPGDRASVSRAMLKRREVAGLRVGHRVLGESGLVSLVQLDLDSYAAGGFRVYLTEHGSPVLGDQLFQRRLTHILGESVRLSPSEAAKTPLFIPRALLHEWGLTETDYPRLPFFGHAYGITLPGLLTRRQLFQVSAPLPPHFLAAVQSLSLLDCVEDLA